VINDLYKPYLKPNKNARHYVTASRIVMLCITVLAVGIALQLDSILQVYKYVVLVGGGVGTVLMARWYWWRVNIYAEITAYALSFILAPLLTIFISNGQDEDFFAIRLVIITTVVTVSWITVAYLTTSKPEETTLAFYKKLRIGGPGWKAIEKQTGISGETKRFWRSFQGWLLSCLMLYGALLGIGKLLFHQWFEGALYLLLSILSAYFLQRGILKRVFGKPK
jgi:SSS family solute:Na+ symporter